MGQAMRQMLDCMQQVNENLSALQKRNQRKPMSELVCHECNKVGHIRPFCPDNPNRRQPGQGPRQYRQAQEGPDQRQGYQVRFDTSKRPEAPRWFSNEAPYTKPNAVNAVDDMLGLDQQDQDPLNE